MEPQRFDISFKGEILPGFELAQVKQALAGLFKADSAQLTKLFSGQVCTIKKGVDQATALKYQQALKKAGAKPIITQAKATPAPAAPTPETKAPAAPPATSAAPAPKQEPASTEPDSFDVLPVGSDMLKDTERRDTTPVDIDTSSLSASADFERLADEPSPAPAAPDVSHISLGQTGEDMSPYARQDDPRLDLDLSAIELAATGSDLQDEYQEFTELPLDLSALSLAQAGATLAPEDSSPEPQAPDTSHIQLQ